MVTAILEGAPYAILVLVLLDAARTYPSLPPRIPRHFGVRGEPQAYGPRWLIFLTPLLVLPAVALASWGVRHPTRPSHGHLSAEMFFLFLTEAAVLVAVVERSWIAVALGRARRLDFKAYIAVVAAIVVTIAAANLFPG